MPPLVRRYLRTAIAFLAIGLVIATTVAVGAVSTSVIGIPIALAFVPFDVRYPPEWFQDPKAAQPAMKPIDVPYRETWGAMEELQRAGLVKRIGVCNLNISMLRDLLAQCSIRPAVHQLEMHPYLVQPRQLRYCQQERIAVTAFSPLGAPSYLPLGMALANESVLVDPVVTRIAAAHTEFSRVLAEHGSLGLAGMVLLVLAGFFTFQVSRFFDAGQADLQGFFFWHPWLYLILVPAVTMRSSCVSRTPASAMSSTITSRSSTRPWSRSPSFSC